MSRLYFYIGDPSVHFPKIWGGTNGQGKVKYKSQSDQFPKPMPPSKHYISTNQEQDEETKSKAQEEMSAAILFFNPRKNTQGIVG